MLDVFGGLIERCGCQEVKGRLIDPFGTIRVARKALSKIRYVS